MRVMCAILFLCFSFLYLYEYQADVLAVAQHVLSDGQTHYNRTIGAVLITAGQIEAADPLSVADWRLCCNEVIQAYPCDDLFPILVDFGNHHGYQSGHRPSLFLWCLVGRFPVASHLVWLFCLGMQGVPAL